MTMMRQGDFFTLDDSGEDFEVGIEIGKGGFGVVHMCTRLSDNAEFVCKSPIDHDELKIRKLKSENKILKDLESKNVPDVVKSIGLGNYQDPQGRDLPVLVMVKAPGDILNKAIKEATPHEKVAEIMLRIAESMDAVHKAGYIHRDLKPDNIMYEQQGNDFQLTIIDFGIAAVKEDSKTFALTSSRAATPFYAPPEQMQGTVSIGNDIFSVGATGYYLLVGSERCKRDKDMGLSTPYNPKNHLGTSGGDEAHLHNVVIKATQTKRYDRFATMEELIAYLKGGRPAEDFPRFVIDGRAYPLQPETAGWIIGRAGYGADFPVSEFTGDGGSPYISRTQAEVLRKGECHFLLAPKGTNDTRIGNEHPDGTIVWKKVEARGYPLGPKFVRICFGYSEHPPNRKDQNGYPLVPGPYKVIEYFPPSEATNTSA